MKKQIMALCLSLTGGLAGLAPSAYAGDPVNPADAKVIVGPAAVFTGKTYVRLLTRPTAPGQAGTALVTFEPGARSNWHTHPAGQTLYVTQGCGWTQEEGGPVQRICAGDMVYVKPGVRHWHGATASETMTHLAITEVLNGKNVEWMEPVSDAQFHGPDD
ncbi:(R)-mandelonitrile lyase [Novosphingobium beihaiensis]|uniref:Cupin domain-containing protein n=1 Tax=Novosphingobium beihaiensis TaxID=2930389 RepID=A0ABT0BL15_9SPHN|nr:cupin domain-containing protein [Novosphingobium beihaiensis]MCJ2185755.1 cupin domain-containing protein [Novosphingobium beihaiensis]